MTAWTTLNSRDLLVSTFNEIEQNRSPIYQVSTDFLIVWTTVKFIANFHTAFILHLACWKSSWNEKLNNLARQFQIQGQPISCLMIHRFLKHSREQAERMKCFDSPPVASIPIVQKTQQVHGRRGENLKHALFKPCFGQFTSIIQQSIGWLN